MWQHFEIIIYLIKTKCSICFFPFIPLTGLVLTQKINKVNNLKVTNFMNAADAFIYWKSNSINVFDCSKTTDNENTIVQ